jgi:hypothetical protein
MKLKLLSVTATSVLLLGCSEPDFSELEISRIRSNFDNPGINYGVEIFKEKLRDNDTQDADWCHELLASEGIDNWYRGQISVFENVSAHFGELESAGKLDKMSSDELFDSLGAALVQKHGFSIKQTSDLAYDIGRMAAVQDCSLTYLQPSNG